MAVDYVRGTPPFAIVRLAVSPEIIVAAIAS
jgi:hypothetical protein